MELQKRNLRKERIGIVTSNKMHKSIVVSIQRRVKHTLYGKFVKKTSKFTAHDEENQCNEGDTFFDVIIFITSPFINIVCMSDSLPLIKQPTALSPILVWTA